MSNLCVCLFVLILNSLIHEVLFLQGILDAKSWAQTHCILKIHSQVKAAVVQDLILYPAGSVSNGAHLTICWTPLFGK